MPGPLQAPWRELQQLSTRSGGIVSVIFREKIDIAVTIKDKTCNKINEDQTRDMIIKDEHNGACIRDNSVHKNINDGN